MNINIHMEKKGYADAPMHTCPEFFIHAYTYIYIHMNIYISMRKKKAMQMHVCTHVLNSFVCAYVYMYIYIHIYIYIHMETQGYADAPMQTRPPTNRVISLPFAVRPPTGDNSQKPTLHSVYIVN